MDKTFQGGFANLILVLVTIVMFTGLLATIYLAQQDTSSTRPKAAEEKNIPGAVAEEHSQAGSHAPICITRGKDEPKCHARVVIDPKGKPVTNKFPNGLGPLQLRGAYNLNGLSASGRILAIVVAFDHPNILEDLNTYSQNFGIPTLPACSGPIAASTVPCFQKVDQNGGTSYPSVESAWALETAMDVQVAHGVCPDCKILLVEAQNNSYFDLVKAVDTAVALGATVVSNSWGSSEFEAQGMFDTHFNKPGVAFVFSSGDGGFGTSYPAASKYVTAVGGTTLYVNSDNTFGSETTWSGSGSGCSIYSDKPTWQKDTGCVKRTIADVSAVADPNTGAAIYSSISYSNSAGWFKVGGTSLSAPIIAAAYALKGIPAGIQANSLPYTNGNSTNLRDITSGSNGGCNKKTAYLCAATRGYDGPTGLGTPKGVNAF